MIQKETDCVGKMLKRLPQNMRYSNWQNLVRVEGFQSQELEDAVFQVLLGRSVDDAVGAQLDLLGKLVGQPRYGLVDDDYKVYIRARVSTNNSEGTIEDLISVVQGIIGSPGVPFYLRQVFPKTIDLQILEEPITLDLADILLGFMSDAKEGGVRFRVHHLTGDLEDTFTLGARTKTVGFQLPGATTITVVSTEGFPTTGTIRLPSENLTYSNKDATHFLGTSPLVGAILSPAVVKEPLDSNTGLGDNTDPLVGGILTSAQSG